MPNWTLILREKFFVILSLVRKNNNLGQVAVTDLWIIPRVRNEVVSRRLSFHVWGWKKKCMCVCVCACCAMSCKLSRQWFWYPASTLQSSLYPLYVSWLRSFCINTHTPVGDLTFSFYSSAGSLRFAQRVTISRADSWIPGRDTEEQHTGTTVAPGSQQQPTRVRP